MDTTPTNPFTLASPAEAIQVAAPLAVPTPAGIAAPAMAETQAEVAAVVDTATDDSPKPQSIALVRSMPPKEAVPAAVESIAPSAPSGPMRITLHSKAEREAELQAMRDADAAEIGTQPTTSSETPGGDMQAIQDVISGLQHSLSSTQAKNAADLRDLSARIDELVKRPVGVTAEELGALAGTVARLQVALEEERAQESTLETHTAELTSKLDAHLRAVEERLTASLSAEQLAKAIESPAGEAAVLGIFDRKIREGKIGFSIFVDTPASPEEPTQELSAAA